MNRTQSIATATAFLLLSLTPSQASRAQAAKPSSNQLGFSTVQPAEGPFVKVDGGYMLPYTETIPGTKVTFRMIPISAGTVLLGSPTGETGRLEDEGPQVRVSLGPMWVGECEVTWAEYQAYMEMYEPFKVLNDMRIRLRSADDAEVNDDPPPPAVRELLGEPSPELDAVTCPTPLYDPSYTYQTGEDLNQPAVTMTQFAAKQYTKWLSGMTGQHYRLPTEAEWEYAARGGTKTAYSFGDDVQQLTDYAWFADNSEEITHAVGTKRPNAFGLHDMHGNVAEWVLDEYRADHYGTLGGEPLGSMEAVAWPTRVFPRAIRGGSYYDEASQCRSAARGKSDDPDWDLSDPNLPKSPWWFTEDPATGVGFRLVRPLEPMNEATRKKVWDADVEYVRQDVANRLKEGRGAQSPANRHLPAALESLKAADLID